MTSSWQSETDIWHCGGSKSVRMISTIRHGCGGAQKPRAATSRPCPISRTTVRWGSTLVPTCSRRARSGHLPLNNCPVFSAQEKHVVNWRNIPHIAHLRANFRPLRCHCPVFHSSGRNRCDEQPLPGEIGTRKIASCARIPRP